MSALALLPVVTLVLLATNRYHGLVFTDWSIQYESGIFLLHKTPGPWWWIDTVIRLILLPLGRVGESWA